MHQQLVGIAKNDAELAPYLPGAPARIEYLPGTTLFSLFKIGTYFGLPALITWLIGYCRAHTPEAMTNTRRAAGLCIHCAYDCEDLPSPTCPECGQPHRVPNDPPILESNA